MQTRNRNQTLSRLQIYDLVAQGHSIVIYDGAVLKLDGWMEKHPGGRLAISYMVGRDATDEINAFHSAQTLATVLVYRIGLLKRGSTWGNFLPPIKGGKFDLLVRGEKSRDRRRPGRFLATLPSTSESSDQASDSESLYNSSSSASSIDILIPPEPEQRYVKERKSARHVTGPDSRPKDRQKTSVPKQQTQNHHHKDLKGVIENAHEEGIRLEAAQFPSVDIETQRNIALEYRALHKTIIEAGLYQTPYSAYGLEILRYLTLFCIFCLLLRCKWYLASAVFLGLFWHQIMFTAHDAGHRAISHNFTIDSLIGMFIADFCCGLSIGWWKSSHNVHHLVTNEPDHDPDLQNLPLFATSSEYLRGLDSTYYGSAMKWDAFAEKLVPYQKYFYYPVMGIARFNLYLLSWHHILSSRNAPLGAARWTRPVEICFMAGYWVWFGYFLLWQTLPDMRTRVAFILISHIITMPLHVQITLSHWGMPTAHLGQNETFAQRQLRTTMDVDCPAWLDFIHGGLQFQAIHHLFPRLPRHNLRKAQTLTQTFCKHVGVPYRIFGFVDGNKKVLSKLGEVAHLVDLMVACQKHMAETGESGLH